MTNPYTYLFYILYKLLNPIVKEKDRLPFGIISIIGLLLLVHSVFTLILLNMENSHVILPQVNSFVFGGIMVLLFYIPNYYFFEKDERYLKKMEKMSDLKRTTKNQTKIILLIYFLLPLIVYLIK